VENGSNHLRSIILALAGGFIAFAGILVPLKLYWWATWFCANAVVLFGYALIEGKAKDRKSRLAWIDRYDNVFIYDSLVARVDRTVTRLLMPETAEKKPRPEGRFARLMWYTTPRARDAAD